MTANISQRPVTQISRHPDRRTRVTNADMRLIGNLGDQQRLAGVIQQQTEIMRSPHVRQFRIEEVRGDFLTCREYNVDAGLGTTIYIAKPYCLRQSPFDNKTIAGLTYTYAGSTTRDVTDGVDTETQIIIPFYQEPTDDYDGDIIYAIFGVHGGTGVGDVNEQAIQWLDLNVDGRAWAQEYVA